MASSLLLNNFKKQLSIFIILGSIAYILDISTSENLYTKCKSLYTQPLLLIHHIIYIFSLFGWLSNNIYILVLNIITIISLFLHWKINNNLCTWTESIKKDCNIKQNLRTFIKILFPNYKDKNRVKQKFYLSFVLFIIILKLFLYHTK
jgi:hypothetical protein